MAENTQSEIIAITVKDQDGGELLFKVKPTTKLTKLMDVYCQKKSKDKNSLVFLYDGIRVADDATPNSLGMEDQDTIDVVVHQTGGCLGLQH